jgi:hypothetical protein
VFPLRYEHNLHKCIKNEVILLAGRGGLQDCEMLRISLMAVKLSASRIDGALLPRNIFYLFVLIYVTNYVNLEEWCLLGCYTGWIL